MASKLFAKFASMAAGKSLHLLSIDHNYRSAGKKTLLFTAAVDNRTRVGQISSRIGLSREAETFDRDTDFYEVARNASGISALLVDEAQFIDGFNQARQLHLVAAKLDIPVLAFFLRSDFQGRPFEGAAALMSLADDVEMIKAMCDCGRASTMNIRLDDQGRRVNEGQQVLIGGSSRYKAACARCFYEGVDPYGC